MSKTKPKRDKKYRPKPVLLDNISHSICGAALLNAEQRKAIIADPERCFDLLRQGIATNGDWNTVVEALSAAEKLCDLNIGNNLRPQIEDALSAMSKVAIRMMKKGGPTACYAQELAALREGLDMYKAQLLHCTQAEFNQAGRRAANCINAMSRGNVEVYESYVAKHKATS